MTSKIIQGVLLDSSGNPISSAKIRFVSTATKSVLNSVETDYPVGGNGAYNFSVQFGIYTIQICRRDEVQFRTVCANTYVYDTNTQTLEELIKAQEHIQEISPEIIKEMMDILTQTNAARADAEDSADAAAASASIATTKASEASTAASNAATSATTATTKANAASTSATNAATSATTATTKATAAATSATSAAESATNAATSATTATTKATEAATSATNAATSATEAATSATNSATSAATATTKASEAAASAAMATAKATEAATSATNAAGSATTATTKANAATTKAQEAGTYATNAAISANTATAKAQESSTSAAASAASETNASTKAQEASNSATAALESKTVATAKAQEASASAIAAKTSETNAAASESNSANSASYAEMDRLMTTNYMEQTLIYTQESQAAASAAAESKRLAKASEDAALMYRDNTNASAHQAEESANRAETYSTSALNSATTATNKATEATTAANAATTKAAESVTSANDSATSAMAAKTSETNASASELAAKNAETSSINASQTATTAANTATTKAAAAATNANEAAQSAALAAGALIEAGPVDLSTGVYPEPIKDAQGNNRSCFWKVIVAGAVDNTSYGVGDSLVYSRELPGYYKIDNTESVTSVNGQQGVVSLSKADVGLDNVDNTSDVDKPISTEQQSALNLKANLASPALTGTPSAPTATVGTSTTQIATTAFVNAEIANDAAPKSHVGTTGTAHGVATTSVAGFMDPLDKVKLDSLSNYTHPASGVTTGTYKSVTVDENGHITAGTNPTTLDGYGITDAAKTQSSINFGGSAMAITTAAFITQLTNLGAFNSMYWCTKAGWSYAGNNYITDTGVGAIQLAGCTVEVIGGSTSAYTIRIHTAPAVSVGGAIPNADFVYVNHGDAYLPKWHKIYNTDNKPTADDVGLGNVPNTVHSNLNVANTVAVRDDAGDLAVRLLRPEYTNQSDMYGAIAFRGAASGDNYLRFCNNPSAVRNWLGTGTNLSSGISNKQYTITTGAGLYASSWVLPGDTTRRTVLIYWNGVNPAQENVGTTYVYGGLVVTISASGVIANSGNAMWSLETVVKVV